MVGAKSCQKIANFVHAKYKKYIILVNTICNNIQFCLLPQMIFQAYTIMVYFMLNNKFGF